MPEMSFLCFSTKRTQALTQAGNMYDHYQNQKPVVYGRVSDIMILIPK